MLDILSELSAEPSSAERKVPARRSHGPHALNTGHNCPQRVAGRLGKVYVSRDLLLLWRYDNLNGGKSRVQVFPRHHPALGG